MRIRALVIGVLWVSSIVPASVQGASDLVLEQLEKRASDEPRNPESWYTLAKYYSDHALEDATLAKDVAQGYVMRGLAADDRALVLNRDYYEALNLKSVLLSQRAVYESNPAMQEKLLDEAETFRARAAKLPGLVRQPDVPRLP